MSKQIAFDHLAIMSDGSMYIRWQKVLVDDATGETFPIEWHRTTVEFDGDFNEQIDEVNKHLKSDGFTIPDDQTNKLKSLVSQVDSIAKADPDISTKRQAKIEQKVAFEAAQAEASKLE